MAKDDKTKTPAAASAGASAGGTSKRPLFLFAGVLMIAIGASVGGTVFFLGGSGKAETKTEETAPAHKVALYQPLKPAFQVTYLVGTKPRVLQAEFSVVTRDQLVLDALTKHDPVVRNRLLDLLSQQDYVALQTDAGRLALREAARQTIDAVLTKESGVTGVENVLFTSFVMQ